MAAGMATALFCVLSARRGVMRGAESAMSVCVLLEGAKLRGVGARCDDLLVGQAERLAQLALLSRGLTCGEFALAGRLLVRATNWRDLRAADALHVGRETLVAELEGPRLLRGEELAF